MNITEHRADPGKVYYTMMVQHIMKTGETVYILHVIDDAQEKITVVHKDHTVCNHMHIREHHTSPTLII